MKSYEFLKENTKPNNPPANLPSKPPAPKPQQKDPNKMLALKAWADGTFPLKHIVGLGRINMSDPSNTAKIREMFESIIREAMGNTDFINLAIQPDADTMLNWIIDRYSRGLINFEDASGEAVDALAKWAALRNQPPRIGRKNNRFPTDVNSFRDLKQLQLLVQDSWYSNVLEKLKNQEEVNKHKRTAKEFVLIDNDRYHVAIPLNFGACYLFNNAEGKQANFCTGGSSGLYWFNNYAPRSPLIMVTDKQNVDDKNGKWQIHSQTDQIVNADQDKRWDHHGNANQFGKLFPGLMKEIAEKLQANNNQIRKAAIDNIENASSDAYNMDNEVSKLKQVFPGAFTDPVDIQGEQPGETQGRLV